MSKQKPFSYSHLNMHCTDSVRQGMSRHLRNALKRPKVHHDHHPKTVCLSVSLNCCLHLFLSRHQAAVHRLAAQDSGATKSRPGHGLRPLLLFALHWSYLQDDGTWPRLAHPYDTSTRQPRPADCATASAQPASISIDPYSLHFVAPWVQAPNNWPPDRRF